MDLLGIYHFCCTIYCEVYCAKNGEYTHILINVTIQKKHIQVKSDGFS